MRCPSKYGFQIYIRTRNAIDFEMILSNYSHRNEANCPHIESVSLLNKYYTMIKRNMKHTRES